MKVITEAYLRSTFRPGAPESIALETGQILTPAATQYLKEMRVTVKRTTGEHAQNGRRPVESLGTGAAKKAEHMTQLHGHTLVVKDHPRILLRGLLDHLQAEIILLQKLAGKKAALVADLADVLDLSRNILKSEVLNVPLEKVEMMSCNEAELRDRSHHPQRHFGIGHVLPDHRMDRMLLELNLLRTEVRKVELAAVTAFVHGARVERPDLLLALNRMSSAVYVMMLKWQTGAYQ
ncbi:MAG: hypothetical protein Q8R88_13460 [Desulfoprunum sp.]|nr:hypothetical protein [Desulfoprunum sp.]